MSSQAQIDLPALDPTLPDTLGGFLDEVAARFGPRDAVALTDALRCGERVCWNYSELRHKSRRVARALVALGVGKGSRVGILLGNRPEFAAALFGIALAGGTAVTLSTFSTRDELDQLLHLSDIAVLLTQRGIASRPLERELAELAPSLPRSRYPFLRKVVVLEGQGLGAAQRWDDFLALGEATPERVLDKRQGRANGNDEAVIIFTSGTTSVPKGIIHLHSTVIKQFRWQSMVYARHLNTRIASPFPLFWSAGLVSVFGSTLAAGGLYVGDEVFEPGASLKLIAREKIDEWYGFPTHTAALAEHLDWPAADLSSLTRVQGNNEFDGHPNTSPDKDWHHIVAYGMSESCTSVVSHLSTTPTAIQQLSAGKPMPGIELKIIGIDDACALGVEQEGEILVRGPTMMPRYLGLRREDSYDAEGYFHTGDIGFIDRSGNLHWTGRIKNMIKTGGANVACGEVEAAATALGSLKLCRAIGMPDRRLGEVVVLCAVKEEGAVIDEEAIRSALRDKLAAYKVPRRVLFFEIEEYPLTATGKVKDNELRELVVARI